MAWVMVDDFTGEVLPAEGARKLQLVLTGPDAKPLTIDEWDVASSDPDELVAQLGEHLSGAAAPLRPLDPGPLDAESSDEVSTVAEPTEEHGDTKPPAESNAAARSNGSVPAGPAESAPAGSTLAAVAEPLDAGTYDVGPVTVGEAANGRPSDGTVRAWAQRYEVPCSTTGAVKRWVRDAYERAEGGRPDEQTWRDAGVRPAGPATNGHALPADAVVQPAGDGTRSRPEQLDEANRLADEGATPKQIVDATGVTLAEARDAVNAAKGPRR